jgi:hypothetical protein
MIRKITSVFFVNETLSLKMTSCDVDELCFNLNAYKDSGQSANFLVNLVSEFITSRGNKYFEIHRKMPKKPYFNERKLQRSTFTI